jgi:hypothetical protein
MRIVFLMQEFRLSKPEIDVMKRVYEKRDLRYLGKIPPVRKRILAQLIDRKILKPVGPGGYVFIPPWKEVLEKIMKQNGPVTQRI